jgi:hypothetical protein
MSYVEMTLHNYVYHPECLLSLTYRIAHLMSLES